jgi:sugar lactone lactonase YvrE
MTGSQPGGAGQSWQATLFVPDAGTLTEGPRWDERTGRLLWTDIYAGTLNSCDEAGKDRRSMNTGLPLGSFAPRRDGGYVLALETGLALSGDDVTRWTPVGEHRTRPSQLRANDGACDPAGRFFAGTMAHDEAAHAGALYRLDAAGADGIVPDPVLVVAGATVSNGLDFSPDGKRMYYADSAELRLDVFAYDVGTGEVSQRRPLVEFSAADGYPDGLTVDAEGYIWLAFWDGGVVRRFDPGGRLVGVVEVPVARVSSCTFGGAGFDVLFITTASYQMSAEEHRAAPLSGSIFRCTPGATGRPINRYAG